MHEKLRCSWSYTGNNPLYIEYHDREWGVPLHDDNHLFEMLVLEGAQAGLSWLTVLKKRDSFRKAFANFDPEAVSLFGESHINELMNNPEIIRNERKIKSAITNAVKGFLKGVGKDSSCHSVSMLLKKAEFDDDLINIAKQIDMYFVPIRDPDSWPDGVPNDFYTLDDVDEAIRISELIIGAIDERWNMLKTPSSPMKRN